MLNGTDLYKFLVKVVTVFLLNIISIKISILSLTCGNKPTTLVTLVVEFILFYSLDNWKLHTES
jgi:hypothetical protein